MKESELKKQAEQDFEEIWKPLLLTDGVLDMEKVKNEMMDLIFVYKQVAEVYSELTGGLLSKPMYYAGTIIGKHQDEVQDAYDDGYADCEKECKNCEIHLLPQ